MGQIIVLTSGKGGVGKTTSAAGLGAALSLLEQRTVVVDLDMGLRKLDLTTGVSDYSSRHWGDVIQKNCTLEEALLPHPHYLSLFILPAPQVGMHSDYTEEEMNGLYQMLSQQFDFVLIDCPAGAEQGFFNAICGAQKALIVAQCETASVRDSDKIARLLTEKGITDLQLIINRYQPQLVSEGVLLSIEQVMDAVKLPLAGIVHEDTALIKAGNTGEPIFLSPDSKGAVCYKNIAKRLIGKEVPLAGFKKPSFFNRLKQLQKKK